MGWVDDLVSSWLYVTVLCECPLAAELPYATNFAETVDCSFDTLC
jgi:hypothetical protein